MGGKRLNVMKKSNLKWLLLWRRQEVVAVHACLRCLDDLIGSSSFRYTLSFVFTFIFPPS